MKLENLPVSYKATKSTFACDQLAGHVVTEKYGTYTSSPDAVLLIPVTTLSKHMAVC